MSADRLRCKHVWGFGSFAVRCIRRVGHQGQHFGMSDGKRMAWGKS